ncbi:hypothetical protein QWY28_00515 [Nocardioides sp. SOB77]|uniref:Uncharacterized protein n=1 Tax=Nocardioides oceani TaxID=3058369 RepID=A0ABT8FB53_9ACTN|nr:hypothetical protein [Nocardioides oceani]MDN4171417.1 hypothetical protein [Nocardioides oceani]
MRGVLAGPASTAGVRATWTTEDGQAGETTVDLPGRWTSAETEADRA